MNNEGKILDLILDGAGKTAAELTHDLRVIGNGDMANGITQIADFAAKSGFDVGHYAGVKKGLCYGLTLAGIVLLMNQLYKWHIKKLEKNAAMWQRFEDQCRTDDEDISIEVMMEKTQAEQAKVSVETEEAEPTVEEAS